jgi:hypothetical protein
LCTAVFFEFGLFFPDKFGFAVFQVENRFAVHGDDLFAAFIYSFAPDGNAFFTVCDRVNDPEAAAVAMRQHLDDVRDKVILDIEAKRKAKAE